MSKTPRPKTLNGTTHRVITGCGYLYVTVTYNNGKLFEVFAHLGKTGGCAAAQTEAICRCISVGFRSGVEPDVFVRQLKGLKCPSQTPDVDSCADAISKVLQEEASNHEQSDRDDKSES